MEGVENSNHLQVDDLNPVSMESKQGFPISTDPPLAQPVLARQLSERTGALQMVGLGMYRDRFVNMGIESLHEMKQIGQQELKDLGLSPLQQKCFQALQAEVCIFVFFQPLT